MTTAVNEMGLQQIPIEQIKASKTNPRKTFDPKGMEELTESVRQKGVLQPILARQVNGHYEIVAGERRFRASKAAGLETIPAIVRDLSEADVLEIQVIENLQRSDLHPLEEAEGYRRLLQLKGYDAAKIAERVGRSVKYVYDRIKLLELIEPLQKAFQENKITAGHAILLARLSAKDQKMVSDKNSGGLWRDEEAHFEAIVGKSDGIIPVSVRELQQWIDEHCRFVPERDADPMLFPETAALLQSVDPKKKSDKIVEISLGYVQDSACQGKKHIAPTSWKRADGKEGSKPCDFSVIGVVVAGEDRAQAFRVCIAKEKCMTHWGERIKQRAKTKKMAASGDQEGLKKQREKQQQEEQKRKEEEARREAERARYRKSIPKIIEALAAAIKKAPALAGGLLAKIVLDECMPNWGKYTDPAMFIGKAESAEDVVRHGAFLILGSQAANDYHGPNDMPKILKAFNLDLKKIMDEAAPLEKPKAKAVNKKK